MITDIEVLIRNWGSTANTKVEILDGIWGTIIWTSEIKDITNSSNEFINFNFSAPVSVTSSTQYYFRLPETSWPLQYATYSLDVYSWGQRVDNWSATTWETIFKIHSINNEDITKVYLADSSSVNKTNFIWFASESGVLDDVKKLNTAWVDSNQSFSASDIGKDSYLSDTPWQISTTPWTNVVKVGKILSTTELLINTLADKAEDVDFLNFTTAWGSASYETTYSHDLWKIPTKFECFTKNYATSSATSSFGWFENWQYASLWHEGGSRDDCMGQVFYSSWDYFKMTVSEITNTSFKIIYTEVWSCSTVSSYGVVLKIS